MDVFCSVVAYGEQETQQSELNLNSLHQWLWHFDQGGGQRPSDSFSSNQIPHRGQGRSLKSTGPPRPASASSRDMMTAMAASSLLGLLDPGSSMMSMLRWELSPGRERRKVRKRRNYGQIFESTCPSYTFQSNRWRKSPFFPNLIKPLIELIMCCVSLKEAHLSFSRFLGLSPEIHRL